ncbi:MAG: VWA domain-containing protein, partial [Acidobacteriota bacterium]
MPKRGRRHDRPRFLVAITVAVALAGAVHSGAAAQERPQFETTVEVVQLQVALEDDDGDHVVGLGPDDFTLRVEGEPRNLVAVYEVDLGDEEAPREETLPPAGWRQFLLFFDFTFATRQGVGRAREAALQFIQEATHPLDLVGVATYSRVNGLRLVVPFTADHAQARDAVRSFRLERGNHIVDPLGFAVEPLTDLSSPEDESAAASGAGALVDDLLQDAIMQIEQADFRRYRDEVVRYADELGVLGRMLQATRGRKHVVLFSSGFDDKVLTGQSLDELAADHERMQQNIGEGLAGSSAETRFGSAELRSSLDAALEQLRMSDSVFHVVDSSGLGQSANRQGLNYLADGTDGTIAWNRNDLSSALTELAEQTSRFYVLAYRKAED